MINELKISNFRQFKNLKLEFNKNIIIIHGDNTKGKSTILEAIYLLTNGETPWGDFDDEFHIDQEENEYFRIEGQFDNEKRFVYFRDKQKRQLKADAVNTTSKKFFSNFSSIMFSPEQIDLLMISSSKRRDFLDNILAQIDYEYVEIHSIFSKSLKQRNAYLKKLSKAFYEKGIINIEDPQLIYWTNQIAKYSAIIMSKRQEIINKIQTENIQLIYNPSVTLNLFEDLADIKSIESITIERLKEGLKRDIATGISNIGAHRDDWTIIQGKDIKRFGSRGEKRVAIGRLIFEALELISEAKESRPILLLDDISSELDKANTEKTLLNDILDKQQTFITAIELNHIPKEIREKSQIIDLNSSEGF